MANLSKEIFDRNFCKETPCSYIHPWSDKCSDGLEVLLINVVIGCAKFFGPIYVLKLILQWKKLNKELLKENFIGYLRTLIYGLTFGGLLFGNMCLLAKIKPSYYNVMICGFIGSLSILVETQENKAIDVLLFFNQVLEGVLNVLTSKKFIIRSRLTDTLGFMFISSALMYLFKKFYLPPKFFHLWFFRTKSIMEQHMEKPQSSCNHEICRLYAYKGAYKYFCIGFLIEFIKNVLPRMGQLIAKPSQLPSRIFNRQNVLFGLFFGGYAFLYRTITCHLLKIEGFEHPTHAMIAGFLAGATYYLRPNIQIPIIGVTTILQILGRRIHKKYELSDKIPYSVIVFSLSAGILMHLRFHMYDDCPIYTRNMLSMVTNSLADKIYNNLWNILYEADKSLIAT